MYDCDSVFDEDRINNARYEEYEEYEDDWEDDDVYAWHEEENNNARRYLERSLYYAVQH